MQLTNQQFLAYVGRIKLTQEMKRKYKAQLDNLIDTVQDAIKDQTDIKVTRTILAGSWKKGTALRPRNEHPLDADLVFFLNVDEAAAEDIAGLNATLLDFLLKAYPNKKPEDFKAGEKTVNLVFRGTGLKVDLVPVVPLKKTPAYVWQPTTDPSPTLFITSVDGQLDFVVARKAANTNYTSVVRMLKAWKARKELEISSFAIELLVAHLDVTRGVLSSIEGSVIRFFEFLARDERLAVSFSGAAGAVPATSSPAYLGDPTYNPNNVLSRMEGTAWDEVRAGAETAWETLEFARSKTGRGDTVVLWKEVFGSYFNIEEEET